MPKLTVAAAFARLKMFAWKLQSGDREATAVATALVSLVGAVATAAAALLLPNPSAHQKDRVAFVSATAALVVFFVTLYLRHAKHHQSQKVADAPYEQHHKAFRDQLRTAASKRVEPILSSVRAVYVGLLAPEVINTSNAQDRGSSILEFPYIPAVAERLLSGSAGNSTEIARQLSVTTRLRHRSWNKVTQRQSIEYNLPKAFVFDEDLKTKTFESLRTLEFVIGDYVTYEAIRTVARLRDEGAGPELARLSRPRILGAGAILVHPTTQQVGIFQRKKLAIAALPKSGPEPPPGDWVIEAGKNHVAGGDFEPLTNLPGLGYDRDLEKCAEREILEEFGLAVRVRGAAVFIHQEQIDDRWFCPVHFCGVIVDEAEVRNVRNPEGEGTWARFEQLSGALKQPQHWVASGWYSMMLWLYLGAPCQNNAPVFSAARAKEMFADVVASIRHAENPN